MKVHIWIKKEDVKKGVITEYHTNQPQISYSSYVQVSITSDEYVQLSDQIYDPIDSGRSEQNYTYCNEWKDKRSKN